MKIMLLIFLFFFTITSNAYAESDLEKEIDDICEKKSYLTLIIIGIWVLSFAGISLTPLFPLGLFGFFMGVLYLLNYLKTICWLI